MTPIQALILGLVQGAAEFIPVSSSGHLVLVPWLLRWPEPGLAFDITLHWGTLAAVVAVFWRDLWRLVVAWLHSLHSRSLDDVEARVAWWIIVGTVPGVAFGLILNEPLERLFSAPEIVAVFLLITAAILSLSERLGRRDRDLDRMTWLDALLVGVGQALAIMPGISRSGATIASGLLRGLKRETAARFSFLLSTPIIVGAGLPPLLELAQAGDLSGRLPTLILGFAAAAISGYLCIRLLLNYLQQHKLYIFAAYCAVAGLVCLIVALVR
ncbi:MAG: undecaprenyl-diphosphatase UppP [Chloroflexota bacterium]|nr:undecaprenyl-diphosphatase UppP [Chloroflexota bacterium]